MSFEAALTTLYRDFLLREPDADGLAYWNSVLTDASLSLEDVADQMLKSDEFQADVQPVIALYAQILQRPADAEGLQYWVAELRQGASIDAIGDAIKASEEAQTVVMTLDDEAWLTNAYSSLLAREPDAEGFAYWLEQLENGTSRDVVSQSINASEEAGELVLTQVVGTLLNSNTPEQALDAYLTDLLGVDTGSDSPNPEPEEPSEPEVPTPDPQEPEAPSEPEQPSPSPAPSEPEEPSEPEMPGLENPSLGLAERYHVGTSDASTAIAVGERLMLVADDEDQVLRLYERDADGEPLASVNLNDALGLNDTQEADLEAVATLDGVQYWLGSHESAQRSMLFATRITGDDADSLNIEVEGQFTALAEQLQAWDANDGHGLGAGAKALASGINIEGAAFVGDTLMLGLRAPLDNGLAQVIPVNNAPALVAGEATDADIGTPLRLDLEGRVVRAIEPAGDGSYLVLAGPENDDDELGFALYQWDGAHAVRQVEGPDLNTVPDALTAKPESLFDVQATESGFTAGVLYDSGTADWLDDGQESKDLPAEQQRFIGVDIEFDTLPGFTPRPGDMAITAVQTDTPDDFQFVVLKGIAAGAEITFTDSGWSEEGFLANEGAVTWTAPTGGVAPGTLISLTEQTDQFREANGEAVGSNGLNLSGSGDQVIAFTGTPEEPAFLFAVQTNSSEWQESASSANDSGLPLGLEEGVTAVAVGESVDAEYDNAAYVGTGNGTAAELLYAIANPANWAGDNTALPSAATRDFQIGTMEEIHVPGNRDIGLVVSEIWSGQSGPDVTEDWFEITNRSLDTLDFSITPLYYDDDSADPEDAVQIQGLDTLAPGETAVVMVDGNANAVAEFRAAWSNLDNIDSLKIGYAEDASGLGGGGDAVTLWLGDPRTNGDQVASAAYPDTDGFDAAAWDADAGRFISVDDSNAESTSALGGDGGDVPAVATPGSAEGAIQITEIWPGQSGPDVTEDWFEITNRSTETIDVSSTSLYYDDDSSDPENAVQIQGLSELAPGESALVMVDGNADAVAEFRAAWNGLEGVDSLQVGFAEDASGLGGGGDAATLWRGNPLEGGIRLDTAAYPDTDGFDAAAWDVDAGRFTSADDSNAETSSALGGDGGDVPAVATPGSTPELTNTEDNFQLQLLHAADMEGGGSDLLNAPNFVAIVDHLQDQYANTLTVSSGDLVLPGPYLTAGGDDSLQPALQAAAEAVYGLEAGSLSGIGAEAGRVETLLADLMGVSAVTLGNHEFDQGTGLIADMIAPLVNEGGTLSDIDWVGSQFPYLSANLDFSADGNLEGLATEEILDFEAFLAGPQAVAEGARPPKLAPAMIQEVGGEKVGVIGLTTQILESISSPGDTQVLGGGSNDMQALADIVQPIIDELTEQGVNKIVLASHLQQIQFEEELATLLEGVDIVMAGGSNSLLADSEDVERGLFPGAFEPYDTYPMLTQDAAGNDVAIINTDGGWRYVGQLVVEFDAEGNLLTESLDPDTSGVYAATDDQVAALWGDTDTAFAEGSDGAIARDLVNAVAEFVADQDGNILGLTDTYLVGERGAVRTEETNLGNLTADANLWYARQVDAEVMVSLKNGGGIREPIGQVVVQGEDSEPRYEAPAADLSINKPAGGVSQLDAAQTLRFNNDLVIVTVTRETLVDTLEHAVAESEEGNTPGRFPQLSGVEFSFDWDQPEGSRVQSAAIVDDNGNVVDVLVEDGQFQGSAEATLKMVTLNFLADGGDGFFAGNSVLDRVDLVDSDLDDGLFTFAEIGTEQDAFAEYMGEFFSETPFSEAETPASEDTRIQNLDVREDTVLTGVDTTPFSMDAA